MENCRRDLTKARKKITRCIGILQRDIPSINISEIPTKHIFIGNAGLTTNADESSLVELITSVGSGLEALTLLPGKQYSFASFTSTHLAHNVYLNIHGNIGVRGSTTPVYMAFVDKVPLDPSPIKFKYPPGLQVIEDFISHEEEGMLMNLIDWQDTPLTIAEGSVLKHRQVRHYGYEFQYNTNSVDKDHPLEQGIPPSLCDIQRRITDQGCMPVTPDQLTVNRYLPGQGIPPHVDTHSSFTGEILSLSVGGGVNMDFRYVGGAMLPHNGDNIQHNNGDTVKDKPPHYVVYLPPRSLCIMTGPARYEWSHGICPRMTDVVASKGGALGLQLITRTQRLSYTFRKIRPDECPCLNPYVCDSYIKNQQVANQNTQNSPEVSIAEKVAAKLEKDHVLQVYDKIAGHFSITRHKPWPKVLDFVCSLPLGSMLLDVGCGNGKYMGHNKKAFQIGCDTSSELMKICNSRGFEVLTCNCLKLPYRDAIFDATICIAVIHHLATQSRRLGALAEMARVLRKGGRGLVYVWAMEQKRGDKKSTYLKPSKKENYEEGSIYCEGKGAFENMPEGKGMVEGNDERKIEGKGRFENAREGKGKAEWNDERKGTFENMPEWNNERRVEGNGERMIEGKGRFENMHEGKVMIEGKGNFEGNGKGRFENTAEGRVLRERLICMCGRRRRSESEKGGRDGRREWREGRSRSESEREGRRRRSESDREGRSRIGSEGSDAGANGDGCSRNRELSENGRHHKSGGIGIREIADNGSHQKTVGNGKWEVTENRSYQKIGIIGKRESTENGSHQKTGGNIKRELSENGSAFEPQRDGTTCLPIHTNRTEFREQDMLVPWKLRPQRREKADGREPKCGKECAKYHCCGTKKNQGCSALSAQRNKLKKGDASKKCEGTKCEVAKKCEVTKCCDVTKNKSENKCDVTKNMCENKCAVAKKWEVTKSEVTENCEVSKSEPSKNCEVTENCEVSKSDASKNCEVSKSDVMKKSEVSKSEVTKKSDSEQVFHRFYHVFKEGELEMLCDMLGVEVIKCYYDEGNWCVIFEKT